MRSNGFSAREQANKHSEVNFDVRKMNQAMSGQHFVMPEEMSRAEFREWMRENANKCRTK